MSDYLFVDDKNEAYGKIVHDKLFEIYFSSKDLNNIYRAKVTDKISSINGYFLEYDKDSTGFLKSNKNLPIGSSVICQVVREKSNKKLPLLSQNFELETENYSLSRFPSYKKPVQKYGRDFSKEEFHYLLDLREKINKEENFLPTPKLILENNERHSYFLKNKDLEVRELDIKNSQIIKDAFDLIRGKKNYFGEASIIVDELETLTAIDVNSSGIKSSSDKDIFFERVNLSLLNFIAYNLKLRNIGGMVVVDFLRNENQDLITEKFIEELDHYKLDYEIFGFTKMGLFELSLKRKSESLKRQLKQRKLI